MFLHILYLIEIERLKTVLSMLDFNVAKTLFNWIRFLLLSLILIPYYQGEKRNTRKPKIINVRKIYKYFFKNFIYKYIFLTMHKYFF